MEHFAPHNSAVFEGYYSKFDLPSGAHIALIICAVPKATKLPPYMVSFTYYPANGSNIFQREHWVSSIHRITTGPGHAFELRVEGDDCRGIMSVGADSTTTYELRGWGTPSPSPRTSPKSDPTDPGPPSTTQEKEEKEEELAWSLNAMTTSRTPWNPISPTSTPESLLIHLPLPLHWHVHSLCSEAIFHLSIPSLTLPRTSTRGRATIHQEKNWARSFPSAHIWIQAHSPSPAQPSAANNDDEPPSTICLAGGSILRTKAFLLAYRTPTTSLSLTPPFTLSFLSLSPFSSFRVDYPNRAFHLDASNFRERIVVDARAPRDRGWFRLAAPFRDGHRRDMCTESFLATVEVRVFRRDGWWFTWWAGGWREVERRVWEGASLEFAAGWFEEGA